MRTLLQFRQVAHHRSVLRCLGAFIPTTTFIRDLRTLLQIRQVAHLRSGDMQPSRFKPRAEERTCNPVQRPNFRGQGTRNPKRLSVPRSRKSTREDRIERNPKVAVLPPMGEGHQPVVVGIG